MDDSPTCVDCADGHSFCPVHRSLVAGENVEEPAYVPKLRAAKQAAQINKQVFYMNRVKEAVEDSMKENLWADCFAAVSVLDLENPVEIFVHPFQVIPSPEVAEEFEQKWQGAQVTWFTRQGIDAAQDSDTQAG